ncbi:MAG: radical SAM protein [Myxococcota bacterium]
MRACLIYPPLTDPRAPQLALPSLAAVLRPAGIETELLDLNVTGVEAILSPQSLAAATARLERSQARGLDTVSGRLIHLGEALVERMPKAFATLRSPAFYDAAEYNAARSAITTGLELISAAAERPGVALNVAPIKYDLAGVDPSVLADLLTVTADPRANVFLEHWERAIFPALSARRPDLVGITITNRQQILPGLMLARALKSQGHYVVLGGAVYTKFQAQLAERPQFFQAFADGVVVYEGETALLELCRQLDGPRDFSKVPNYLWLDRDQVRVNSTYVEHVDQLPTPDFEGLPLDRYLVPEPVLPILAGKGCYFNKCKFCDIPYINIISPKNYRVRAPETIVADVAQLHQRFKARHFVITDEALAPKLLMRLADAFAAAPHPRYAFTGYARLEEGFTPEVVGRMAEMGIRKIYFGLESASQKTQDHMDKGTKVSEAPAILKAFRDAEVAFHLFSIVGFPEETEADAEETFRFFLDHQEVVEFPANTFDIHPFGLELRTSYWDDRERFGIRARPGALERDFVIGLRGKEWINERGLSMEEAVRLIYGNYLPRLRQRYRRWHNTMEQLYPGFEEYAALYVDHWRGRTFPHRTSLPTDGSRFRLRLNPSYPKVRVPGGSAVVTKENAYVIAEDMLAHLEGVGPIDAQGWLAARLGSTRSPEQEAEILRGVDQLFELGVLQLSLEPQ